MRKCGNCKHRYYYGFCGAECCMDYEMTGSIQEEIEVASTCERYEEGRPSVLDDEEYYCPSSTNGDYSPSNPWDAPGMSIRDFI